MDTTNPTIKSLLSHRSIRRFQDRPLPEGLLERLIACGQRASTSSNLQAYTVIHLADSERKTELARLCADQVQIHQSAAFLAFCADLNRCRMAGRMHRMDRFDGDYVEALVMAVVDVGLMMQNVAVAAESLGLGVCMIGAMRNHPKAVGKLLDLPPFVFAIAGMCLGYPGEEPMLKPRLPLEAVLHRDHYLDDEAHRSCLKAYDREMVEFYESQRIHPDDPRWTAVVAQRVGQFRNRAELDVFLRKQGFDLRSET